MKLAILFWFYKEPEICKNRLELLRKNNPTTPIYGLYGGDLTTVEQYKFALDDYLDDFYVFPENKDSMWKWLQGDLLLTHWHRERGKYLEWDTIIIVQWDMLLFGPVEQVFSTLQKDQILLSGLRPIREVEHMWRWVSSKVPEHRQQYCEFLNYVRQTHNYQGEPLGCLFVVVCLPKIFLDRYSYIQQPELGFIEYRVPIYAQIFDVSFCRDHTFNAWWLDLDPTSRTTHPVQKLINVLKFRINPNPLSLAKRKIPLIPIYRHLLTPKGARIFHPYEQVFPLHRGQWLQALFDEFIRDLQWLQRVALQRFKPTSRALGSKS